jgi:GT2 family glycosyltransferase
MQTHPQVGVIGPQLLNADGSVQSSRRHFPTLPILFLESTWFEKFAPRTLLKYYYAQQLPDHVTQEVDWVTGAAMLVRREAIDEVGAFDEGFFMYSEELDWCQRIKLAGWQVIYYPEAQIVHYEGKSSEQVVPARHIYFQSSKVRYTRKTHGVLIAECLRLWLLAQYAEQIALEGIKWLLGNQRPLRASRIAAYNQVLRSKLRYRKKIRAKDATVSKRD